MQAETDLSKARGTYAGIVALLPAGTDLLYLDKYTRLSRDGYMNLAPMFRLEYRNAATWGEWRTIIRYTADSVTIHGINYANCRAPGYRRRVSRYSHIRLTVRGGKLQIARKDGMPRLGNGTEYSYPWIRNGCDYLTGCTLVTYAVPFSALAGYVPPFVNRNMIDLGGN